MFGAKIATQTKNVAPEKEVAEFAQILSTCFAGVIENARRHLKAVLNTREKGTTDAFFKKCEFPTKLLELLKMCMFQTRYIRD